MSADPGVTPTGGRAAMPSLARLVGDIERFAGEVWDRQPCEFRAQLSDDERRRLLSIDDVDRIVNAAPQAPALRMVEAGTNRPAHSYSSPARIGSRTIESVADGRRVAAQFRSGSTLVLQSLHRTWEPLQRLAVDLEAEITHRVQINAYLSPPHSVGLAPHADGHDVIVVQLHGEKCWELQDRPALLLTPGDVLYVPRDWLHSASTAERTSLHLTIGIHPTTIAQALERAVRSTGAGTRTLPLGFGHVEPSALAAILSAELSSLTEQLDRLSVDDLVAEMQARRPRVDGRGSLTAAVAHASVSDDWVVRRSSTAPAGVDELGDEARVRLRWDGRLLDFPSFVESTLRFLAALTADRSIVVRELSDLNEASRLVLARRLLDEGFLLAVGEPA